MLVGIRKVVIGTAMGYVEAKADKAMEEGVA
jgi:hypothetical protein